MLVVKNSKLLIKDNSCLFILLDCWMLNQHSLQSAKSHYVDELF